MVRDGGRRGVKSEVMTSRVWGGRDLASDWRASAYRMVCECTFECDLSRAEAARRHLRARMCFSISTS